MSNEMQTSKPFYLRAWGDRACFTRPEMKVERVSYEIMTPSAARGILESILWKPAISWRIFQIDLLSQIKWQSIRRNEVGKKISIQSKQEFFIEEQRQQRAGLFLRDVDYGIHSYFEITGKAGPDDTVPKFTEIFLRRAEKGQFFQAPYFGCREFPANFNLINQPEKKPQPITENRDLGWMLLDLDYTDGRNTPRFFKASLIDGIMKIPGMDAEEGKS
jgi:CRISPR-associated protein Cas5d